MEASGQLHVPNALLPKKASKDWKLRGLQSGSGRLRKEKNRLALPLLKAAALTNFRNKWWFLTKLQNPYLT
jgi:hypothetical protein